MNDPLCQCGCGKSVRIAKVNDKSKGWIKGEPLRFVKGHNMQEAARMRPWPAIGTRDIAGNGYVVIKIAPRLWQYEHILVAERAIGRKLKNLGLGNPNSEVVHHINGDKTDNRNQNLLVCTHRYHTELHHKLEQSDCWPEFPRVIRNARRDANE